MPEFVMDLITGERKPYNPAPPQQDDSGMEGLNPRGVDQLFREQPVDVALKAVEAAIQFQGMRGYQQALKDGQPAEKAMARFGPMIFRKTPQAMGPAVRSLTPPVARPTSALDQARIDEIKRKGGLPTKPDVRNAAGGLFRIKSDGTVETLVERPPDASQFETQTRKVEAVDEIPASSGKFLGFQVGTPRPAVPRTPAYTASRKIRLPGTNAPAATPPASAPANTSDKVRVKGPNGQTGKVPKGTKLPEGWTLE